MAVRVTGGRERENACTYMYIYTHIYIYTRNLHICVYLPFMSPHYIGYIYIYTGTEGIRRSRAHSWGHGFKRKIDRGSWPTTIS